jgi:ribosome biogenesis protein BRX1
MVEENVFEQKGESRWLNKQRTLVVPSRGITERHRHLMLDIINLLPHHKKEAKIEKKDIPA